MSNSQENEVLYLLNVIVRSLCDKPDDVLISAITEPTRTMFQVRCHQTDVGKLIGRQGRTARSLRVILDANGMRLKRSFNLDIQVHDPVSHTDQ
jgi:predicted RNA-binding protein YlqC (UPF0109 family)